MEDGSEYEPEEEEGSSEGEWESEWETADEVSLGLDGAAQRAAGLRTAGHRLSIGSRTGLLCT